MKLHGAFAHFWANYRRFETFLKSLRLQAVQLFLPALLALVASCLEGMSIALLVPTMKGLIQANFQFVVNMKVLGNFVSARPSVFLDRNSAIFALLVLLIFGAAILKNIFAYLSSRLISRQVRVFSDGLRRKLFDQYMGFQKSYLDRQSSGHLHHILIGYTEQVAGQFYGFHQALYSLFSLAVYWALMTAISWKITLFVLMVFPMLYLIFNQLIEKIKSDSLQFSQSYSEMGKKISNALGCLPFIKSISSENEERKWFSHISGQVKNIQISMDKKNLLIQPAQDIFMLTVIVLLVGFMAYLIVREREGELSRYLVFFVLLRRALANVGAFSSMQGALASIRGPLNEIRKIFEDHKQYSETDGVLLFTGLKEKIELKDLHFTYEHTGVLKGINCVIKKGQMTALVGKTGAGKSTLVNLIMRFYQPPQKSIFLDDADINEIQIQSLRRKIAYVSQETYLFDASIAFNLSYGLGREVTDFELMAALEKAQLGEFVKKLSKGLHSEIGERGIRLSGGEKQRISIARAILRNPELLILDEATSALDSHTEMLVQKAIEELVLHKTSIVIAHRLSTIKMADQVLVLDDGRIVEKGNFQELIAQKSLFADMWGKQVFIS